MTLAGKQVLVTGAGGFIAGHLIPRLVADGAGVRAFVYSGNERAPDFPAGVDVVRGDLREADAVAAAAYGADVIIHLGGVVSVGYGLDHPRETLDINVMGTLNVLEAARKQHARRALQDRAAKLEHLASLDKRLPPSAQPQPPEPHPVRVVIVSSAVVYGPAQALPVAETHPLGGESPYAASKIAVDRLGLGYHRSYGLPVVVVRPFNTYGPGQLNDAVIPTAIRQALYEDAVRLRALTPTRDFLYVTDMVAGLIAAAAHPDAVGGVFNLGSGQEVSIGALAEHIIGLTGRAVPLVNTGPEGAAAVMDRLQADISRAREVLDWAPTVTLPDGLRRTMDWFAEHEETSHT